jgi:hypothetical protein
MTKANLEIDKQKRDTMTKEEFLTARWNNWLSLGLGLLALIYAVVVLSIGVGSTRGN